MTDPTKAPERIWTQPGGSLALDGEWDKDEVNPGEMEEYVHLSAHEAALSQARAEVERLREALQTIASGQSNDLAANPFKWSSTIARAALSEQGEG